MRKLATGVPGLDVVLAGGLPANRFYLVEGDPGTGKTTLALQFLLEGARQGEKALYITLSESSDELHDVAASHNWSLAPIEVFEMRQPDDVVDPASQYTIVHPSEIELGRAAKVVFEQVERARPSRVVFDSLSEMRMLAGDPLLYRRLVLSLKQRLGDLDCAALFLDDRSGGDGDRQLQSIAHGVLLLERRALRYGDTRRRLQVVKLRGVRFDGGYHDFSIRTGGLMVYPRVQVRVHGAAVLDAVPSGVAELDTLLGGGLERGTSALILGPAGTGKSVVALQYALTAARRGESVRIYLFEEGLHTFKARAAGLGMPLDGLEDHIVIEEVDSELSQGEFIDRVRHSVEDAGVRVVVLDSLNGYLNAMAEEEAVVVQIHELLRYLADRGVLSIMLVAQQGMIGHQMQTPIDVTYLADTVVMLRFFELRGRVCRAISVVKKRSGAHERTIRELRLGPGVNLGAPLTNFQGVLTGVPNVLGGGLAEADDDDRGRAAR